VIVEVLVVLGLEVRRLEEGVAVTAGDEVEVRNLEVGERADGRLNMLLDRLLEWLDDKLEESLDDILLEMLLKQLPVVGHVVGLPGTDVIFGVALDEPVIVGEILGTEPVIFGGVIVVAGYAQEQTEDISDTAEHTVTYDGKFAVKTVAIVNLEQKDCALGVRASPLKSR
jgi:hypothetical protein